MTYNSKAVTLWLFIHMCLMIKDLSAATLANHLLTLLGQQWKVKNEVLRRPTLWKPHWRQEEWKADRGRLCSNPLVCPGALDFRYGHVAAGIGVCQSTNGAVALQGRHLVWTQESLPQNRLQNLSHELKKHSEHGQDRGNSSNGLFLATGLRCLERNVMLDS